MQFTKAARKSVKVKICLDGPSGSGKTYTALMLAKALGGRTALIDSEKESSLLYGDAFDFAHCPLDSYEALTYMDAIELAKKEGFGNLIIDSLSHVWVGKGGILEQVDKGGGNNFTNGWKKQTPIYNRLIDAILAYPGNVIVTLRSKTAYEIEKNERGQAVPKKLGMAPVIREGSEYEFSFVLDLTIDGNVNVSKTRCLGRVFSVGEGFSREEWPERIKKMQTWMDDGAPVSERDTFADAIRGASSRDVLAELLPKLQALPEELKSSLRGLFNKKVEEFDGTP